MFDKSAPVADCASRGDLAYDVLPDGQRFVFNIADVNTTSRAAVTLVTDWFDELRAKVPVK